MSSGIGSKETMARRTRKSPFTRSALKTVTLALGLITGAAAQGPLAIPDSNVVMGFENPIGWTARGNAASSMTISSTTTRTQGRFAYEIANPTNLTTLTSLPVASTAKAFAGVGDNEATFEIDVLLPLQQGNPVNRGSLQLFISCPSRQLNNKLVGKVDFTPLRLGIFSTIKFPIPDVIRIALGGASFNDLTFEFKLSSPGTGAGAYVFDNLRVHSVALVTASVSTRPPAGYGGSVDLVAIGSVPDVQPFDAAPVQVPDTFHLKLGTAGSTTVQLDLGYDGTPSFTCTYTADTKDSSGKAYILASCTAGIQSGDLVGASWARLTIVGADPSMKLRAQLAKNPVGDEVGGGIIPAMPTFWGDFDGCVPTVVANGVAPPVARTPSASCAGQTAEANKIVTDYFNKVNNNQFPHNWIVTPVPELARRHGDGSPQDLTGPPPPPNDPDFHEGGHINPGGNWDAYWRMDGSFVTGSPNAQDPGADSTTKFDMTLGAHAVLLGQDLNVLSIRATEQSDSGTITPTGFTNPSAGGTLDAYVFGINLYHADVQPSINVGFHADVGDDFTVEAQIWVFDLKLTASGNAGIDVSGTLSLAGANLNVNPHATIGLHAFGGIGVAGIISGGVDVNIPRLLDAKVRAGALLSWSISTDPARCNPTLDFAVLVTADVESDGGDISLVATFGKCPFCFDVSHTIFSWGPILASSPKVLFQYDKRGQLFRLPVAACTAPLNVTISSPVPGANLQARLAWPLKGSAVSSNGGGPVSCDPLRPALYWSISPMLPGDTLSPPTGCSVQAVFTQPGPRTISLHAQTTYASGVTEIGDATPVNINVTPLPAGVYIQDVYTPCAHTPCGLFSGVPYPLCSSSVDLSGVTITTCSDAVTIQPATLGLYTLLGLINIPNADPTKPPLTCTNWSVTGPQTLSGPGPTRTIDLDDPTPDFPASVATWSVTRLGVYSVTMKTTWGACGSGGSLLGAKTISVTLAPLN